MLCLAWHVTSLAISSMEQAPVSIPQHLETSAVAIRQERGEKGLEGNVTVPPPVRS